MKIEIYQCLMELGAQLNEFNIFIYLSVVGRR